MTHTGKYSYVMPSPRSPRLSRWATLAFTPPLVVGLSISICAVFAGHTYLLRALLCIIPAQLFIVPFAFAYCLIPSTLLWSLLEKEGIRGLIAARRATFAIWGSVFGLLFAPPTLERLFALPMKSVGLDWSLLFLISGPLGGAIAAWLAFPKYKNPTP